MKKITGRLFIRAADEKEYRPWNELTREEKKKISEYINREAARAGNFKEIA